MVGRRQCTVRDIHPGRLCNQECLRVEAMNGLSAAPHHSRMEMVMFSITKANVSSLDPSPPELGRGQAEERPSMKILVVDEHFLIRNALCAVIKELKNDATEIGRAHV